MNGVADELLGYCTSARNVLHSGARVSSGGPRKVQFLLHKGVLVVEPGLALVVTDKRQRCNKVSTVWKRHLHG